MNEPGDVPEPEPDPERDRDDDTPDTPPTEPDPVPVREPPSRPGEGGPYIVGPRVTSRNGRSNWSPEPGKGFRDQEECCGRSA